MKRYRVVVAIMALVFATVASAAPSTQIYLPIIQYNPPPIPLPLDALVLQPADLRDIYSLDQSIEIANADAAKLYPNAKAAAKAFQAQGRESSWYVDYLADSIQFFDALGVSDQVFRYTTVAGAGAGQAYIAADTKRAHPDYHPIAFAFPCCTTVALYREFVDAGENYEEYYFSVQVGRYVTDVQLVAFDGSLVESNAIPYIESAVARLSTTPQVAAGKVQSVQADTGVRRFLIVR